MQSFDFCVCKMPRKLPNYPRLFFPDSLRTRLANVIAITVYTFLSVLSSALSGFELAALGAYIRLSTVLVRSSV